VFLGDTSYPYVRTSKSKPKSAVPIVHVYKNCSYPSIHVYLHQEKSYNVSKTEKPGRKVNE